MFRIIKKEYLDSFQSLQEATDKIDSMLVVGKLVGFSIEPGVGRDKTFYHVYKHFEEGGGFATFNAAHDAAGPEINKGTIYWIPEVK